MTKESNEALDVLRGVWSGQGQSVAEIDEACDGASKKLCRNAVHMGFDGLADDGTDLRDAWREQLNREGKSYTKGGSLADLILGPEAEAAAPAAERQSH
jgi:hypothetical protein